MCSYAVTKATNCARELFAGGFEFQTAVRMASASCEVPSYDIIHEFIRRSASVRAKRKKEKNKAENYRKRMEWLYEN